MNGYVRDVDQGGWRPLFSPATLRLRDLSDIPSANGKADSDGVSGVRIAPSNPDVIYATYHGLAWKSSDGGRTIQRLGLAQKTMLTNAGWQRLFNRTIDVHPSDFNRVIIGTWGDGVWFSNNGGSSWAAAALPQSTKSFDNQPGINLVAYDPSAPDRVYVFVTGVGLFRSDNGPGGTFQQLEGGPVQASNLVLAEDGTVHLCEHTQQTVGGKIYRYSPGAGWNSSRPSHEALVIAVNPRQNGHSVIMDPNGHFLESHDHCATFQDRDAGKKFVKGGGEVRWMEGLATAFPAELRFHPQREELYLAQGVGVVRTDPKAASFVLEDWSAGIEELCITSVLPLTGGKLLLSSWDKPFWEVTDLTAYSSNFRYPLRPGATHSANLVAFSTSLDVAGDDPNFVVGVVAPSAETAPGYSKDGGAHWQVFENEPPAGWGNGGAIAASTSSNFVLLPSNNGVGAFTLNGGKSWESIKLDGATATGGFANSFYTPRHNVTADKTRPGTFALVYTVVKNNEFQEPLGGVWLSKDGGRSWRQVLKGVISEGNHSPQFVSSTGADARQFWACQLSYVPGRSGELVYTSHADFKGDRFYWSPDDGATWKEFSSKIRNVTCFGFGKAAPGSARPAIYFSGEVGGTRGVYASFDWFTSAPALVTRFPSEMLSDVSCIAGDPDRLGRFYAGTGCAGCVRIDAAL